MKEEINIAAIVPYKIYPAVSGGQKGIALFYKYLAALLPVNIISVDSEVNAADNRIQYFPLLGSSKLRYINPLLYFRIKNFIKQHRISHLILEHPYYGWLGRLLKVFCKIQLAVHSHNIEALRFKSLGKWWWGILFHYEKQLHRAADINFFITQHDFDYAVKHFALDASKCHLITYGTEINRVPSKEEKAAARKVIATAQHISEDDVLILFNGFFDYAPNLKALDIILRQINPVLMKQSGFRYKIIICGKGLPASYNELKDYSAHNIIYPGFVPDIRPYFIGSDIFINPINDGGGIKTKLVEALSYNLTAVSTESGATGIPAAATGNKMTIVEDDDVQAFCKATIEADISLQTSDTFFNHFYWGNIAGKAAAIILNKSV